jgi:hypothetical protein
MNMLTLITVIIIVSVIAGFFIAFEHFTNCAEADRLYEARHDARAPRQLPADPFSWAATEAIAELERERLATTGELRALYERPYPGQVSDTDQLRALALEGDADTITGIIETWKADNL